LKRVRLEIGRITNTHGLKGEMKVEPWCDDPRDLLKLKTLFVGGAAYAVASARTAGDLLYLKLAGVDTLEMAQTLKGKTLEAAREDLSLAPGSYFIADCENATVVDADSGRTLGTVKEILYYPGRTILNVDAGRELLIPMVSDFIKEVDADKGIVRVHLIDGM
jgi:16S rRNA processing protein RimM